MAARYMGDRDGKPVVRVPAGQRQAGSVITTNVERFPYRGAEGGGTITSLPPLRSAQGAIGTSREKAVRRARDLENNDEFVDAGLDHYASTVVGADLRVKFTPNWRVLGLDLDWAMEFGEAIGARFRMWANDPALWCDAERHETFGGLMWRMARALRGAESEVLYCLPHDMTRPEGMRTCIRVLDTDRLCNPDGRPDSKTLRDGRQLDPMGAAVGYWVLAEHPADPIPEAGLRRWAYLPRETDWGRPFAVHWFFKKRPAQQRGMTRLVTTLRTSKFFNTLDDVEIQNLIADAMLSFVFETSLDAQDLAWRMAPDGSQSDPFDALMGVFESQKFTANGSRIPVLPPGTKLNALRNSRSAIDSDPMVSRFARRMARAMGLTYEQFTGDLSKVNYSSLRGGINEAWKGFMYDRIMFGRHVVAPIVSAFVEEQVAHGLVPLPPNAPPFDLHRAAYAACDVLGPGRGYIDPKKEAEAADTRESTYATTLAQEAAEQGNDWLDNLDEAATIHRYKEKLGLPVRLSAPPVAPPTPADDEPEDEPATRDPADA